MRNRGPAIDKRDKIRGMVLGGAIGDALGAPIEGEKNFQVLFDRFGPEGVQDFVEPISPFQDMIDLKPGETTDDTASLMGTVAALSLSADKSTDEILYHLLQANLIWGSHQMGGEKIADFIDKDIKWPEWYRPFYESLGAGAGTIAALLEGRMGTPENPMSVNREVRGKLVSGPNAGCGGMMRVAPIGLLPIDDQATINLAVRSTAITHGAPEAQAAAAMIALSVKHAFNGASLMDSMYFAIHKVGAYKVDGYKPCDAAFSAAIMATDFPLSCATADSLPTSLLYKNHFLAVPVLSQVVYGVMTAKQKKPDDLHQALARSCTISGDSDSVASMVGNILGAAWGTAALPANLLEQLARKDLLEQAAASLHQTISSMESPACPILS